MPAISVGSVEVDVLPNAQGIEGRLRAALVPPASQIGDEVGRIIGRQIAAQMAPAIRDGINNGARAARPAAVRQGDETAGAFSRSLKARLEAAFRSLPRADVRLSDTGFDADMARLRARLETLSGKRIGIDIDAATALAEITDVEARLRRLGAEHPNVQVRADTARALAELAALRAEVDAVDGKNVDIDASAATASINGLVFAAIALGPAILPVLPVIAAGLGAVAAAGTAAAAGIGSIALVAVPAFKQISTVLQAQKAAQDAATNSTLRGAQANGAGASKANQMAGAQQALATARRNAARQIADAERGVGDAVRQAAQANAQAAQQVKQARQSLADTYTQAADRIEQANEQVAQAERDLTTAQKSARQAQLDLTAARAEASRQLQDMNNQLADAQLSQRDAEIALKEAAAQRNAVLSNGSSSALDRQKAILAYDQAVQRLKEQRQETQRLQSDTAKANKAGVEGSDTVRSAQERLAAAQQDVVDRTSALKKAQDSVAKTQIENTRAIADAQQKLSEAQKNVAETQRAGAENIARAQERVVQAQQSGADSIASAQRQIASASQSAAGGIDQAAIAQAKYQVALDKLTPSARATLNAFVGLRDAFSAWSRALQPAVMPIFTRALNGLKNSLPGLTPFVLAAAKAIGGLQDRVSRGFKSPWWQQFKTGLAASVGPAITGLGVSFGRVFKGMVGIIDAFLPHMDSISVRMQAVTGRFSAWATGLKGSPALEKFLSYSATQGPIVADALGKIFGAFFDVGKALGPIGSILLRVLGGVAEAIGIIAEHAPWLVQGIYAAYIATKLWTIAMWAFNAALAANPITLIIIGIVALTAAVIYAYNRFGWFRTAVQATWSAIQTAALWAWNNVLKPVFGFIWQGLQQLGRAAMWLWTNAIKPAWDAISLAARILLTVITVAVILPIIVAFKVLGAIAGWLWKSAIKPAFEAIASAAVWLYRNVIKPQFDAVMAVFRAVAKVGRWLWENALRPAFRSIGDQAKWLYTNAIKPAFGWIVDRATWLWSKGVKPQFDLLKAGVKAVGAAFKTAKDYIGEQWSKVRDLARKPVQYVVDVVYNNGIRGVWNKVASAFGAPSLPKFKFARGGVMPGYTPGRDVHRFVSPTGGRLELSGGEAIMRPEFTRAVGSGFVNSLNSLARTRGAQGVKAALAPVFGGNPNTPTDTTLRYADGGIFGWIGKAASAAKGAGSTAWNAIKKGASWLGDTLLGSAKAGVKSVVNPLLAGFPGMDTGFGKLIRRIPNKIIDALFGYSKEADKRGGGGLGGPRIAAALKWAKTQNGLPYQWAGNGNPSWDCSGFMSAIESVIRGQKPHRRWATMAFSGKTAPPGWVYHGNSPFRIGITNAGVGHTAGTLGKTNVESRGGDGVVVGSPGPRLQGQPVHVLVRLHARQVRQWRLPAAGPELGLQRHRPSGARLHDRPGERADVDGRTGRTRPLRGRPVPRQRRVPRQGPRRSPASRQRRKPAAHQQPLRELRRPPWQSPGTSSAPPPKPSTPTPPAGHPS
ncbi:phage-related protein [Streptomyces pseudovenezuelae]